MPEFRRVRPTARHPNAGLAARSLERRPRAGTASLSASGSWKSQRRRLVSRSRERSTPDIRDHQPIRDASQDYIRNTMTLWEIEGRSRFPRADGPAAGA